uniref:Ribonuclease 3 n=2 Tax=Elaeis guineensis var. tenera TaxID=51953 RepID=A0A6I9QNU9_ELAGV|nr:ribonuclease 3 [Elaeis guineensis]
MEAKRSSTVSGVVVAFLLGVLFVSPLINAKSFDFFLLVLMWPGAYCSQSTCCMPTTGPPKNDFFVRGLWTYNSDTGEAVTKCNGTSFDVKQLSSLMDDLHSYWSNIKCPSNNGIGNWKSTWKTYGVCSGMNETAYFETALQLRTRVDPLYLLNKNGILQSSWKLYDISDIESAIAEGIKATPVLRCSKGPWGYFQLYEIYICVDKDGKSIIECPVKPRFTCYRKVLFYPFDNEQPHNISTANPIQMPISVE